MLVLVLSVLCWLVDEEPLQDVGTIVVLGLQGVVGPAVGEHPIHVGDEQPLIAVVVGLQPLVHCLNHRGRLELTKVATAVGAMEAPLV